MMIVGTITSQEEAKEMELIVKKPCGRKQGKVTCWKK